MLKIIWKISDSILICINNQTLPKHPPAMKGNFMIWFICSFVNVSLLETVLSVNFYLQRVENSVQRDKTLTYNVKI